MTFKKKLSEEIYNKIDYAKSIVSMEPDKSIKISKEVYHLAKDNKLELEEAYALLSMVLGSRIKTDISSMLDYSYKALEIFEAKNHVKGQGKALNLIGIAYFYGSIYEEALKCFFRANNLVKSFNDESLKISILNNIGEVYRELGIYDKAMEYYTKAIDNISDKDSSSNYVAILANIGQVYFENNEFSKALEAYEESCDILTNHIDIISLGEVENRIGKIYFILGDLKKAEDYYLRSLKRLEDINNKYYSIATLLNLGDLYTKKSSEKAFIFYEKAIVYSKDFGSKKKLCKSYRFISNYYESKGDYKNALEYYKKYSNINEEIISLNLRNKLEILNIDIKNLEDKGNMDRIRIRFENEITRQKSEIEKIKQANEILQKKAYEDELTGLKNRRSINIDVKRILWENYPSNEMLALFMIDIDHFKRYNDYWGHSKGDICIKRISDCIKKTQVSRGDIFGRYGGEEFVYISNSTNYEDALKLGNLIRQEVENIGLYYMYKGERNTTTISVGGIIGHNKDFDSMAEIIELADKELYRAKNMGRNMTILKDVNTLQKECNI